MSGCSGTLTIERTSAGPAELLRVGGVLDSRSYLGLRNSVIKAALDEPAAVLVDVTDLQVPASSAWSVFTSARWHVSTWPDIPVVLVCPRPATAAVIARNGVTRWVPVHPSVEAALGSLTGSGQLRRRASAKLPAAASSLRRARELVAGWLTDWSHPGLVPVAKVVVDLLVDNVLQHTESEPVVMLESSGSTVTVAVSDASSQPAALRETSTRGVEGVSGLSVLAALCRGWGSTPSPTGKTVWGVIGPENEL